MPLLAYVKVASVSNEGPSDMVKSGRHAAVWVVAAAVVAMLSGRIGTAHAADAAAGAKIFRQKCSICHSNQPKRNMVGPSLFGVVGRKTGSEPGYHYSVGNQNANLTWDPATLDRYLQSPRTVVPGTKMSFPGLPDAAQRADVIAYLATLH